MTDRTGAPRSRARSTTKAGNRMDAGTAEPAEEVSGQTPAAGPSRVEPGGPAPGRSTPAPDIEALERLRKRLMAKHYGRRR